MRNIKILGTGCPKCKKTEELVRQVVDQLGIEAKIEKIEDIQRIVEYNVLSTPVVVVDEQVKIKGRVPLADEIKTILQN
jgi:small redox-active disulfide protein 2